MHGFHDGDEIPSSAGASLVEPGSWPEVETVIVELCRASRLPRPNLWYLDADVPNAFASGSAPDQAAVTLTGTLVEMLDRRELRGVLAHEIGHVASGDVGATTEIVRKAMTGVAIASIGSWVLADALDSPLLAIVGAIGSAAFAAKKTRDIAAFNRDRELAADHFAVTAAGEAAGLQSALVKLERSMLHREVPEWLRFAAIVEPPDSEATHPPTLERVGRVEAPVPARRTCGHCAYPELIDHAYCRRCGYETPRPTCRACDAAVDTYDRYCSRCGARRTLPVATG